MNIKEKIITIITNSKLKQIIKFSLTLILFAISSASALYYIFFTSQSEFHSDCADTIMWANATLESGHLFDPNFGYPCLLPFGTSLIMMPFIKIFGLSLTAHHAGMAVFFLLLVLFIFLRACSVSFQREKKVV